METIGSLSLYKYSELLHHAQSHINISHTMRPFYMNIQASVPAAGRDQQRAQELAAVFDIHGNLLLSVFPRIQGKREMAFFFPIFHPGSQLLK